VPIDVANERYRSGYRKTVYNGLELRGFESNAMTVLNAGDTPSVARQWNIKGEEVDTPLYRFQNVIASPTWWYWGETDLLRLWD
jgi:cobyrinic acid a,c-diamide synthase